MLPLFLRGKHTNFPPGFGYASEWHVCPAMNWRPLPGVSLCPCATCGPCGTRTQGPGIISSIPPTKMRIKQQVRKMGQYQRSFDLIFLRYTIPKIKSIFSLELYIVLLQYLYHEVDNILACCNRGETSSQHALRQYDAQVNSVKDCPRLWCLCIKWHSLVR